MKLLRIFAIIFALGFGTTVFAQTASQIAFTENQVSVGVGEEITLRLDFLDASGNVVDLNETVYFTVETDSSTGRFKYGDVWKLSPFETYAISSWSGRNIIYSDSLEGKMTITAKTRDKTWSPVSIIVNVGGSQPASNQDDSDDDEDNDDYVPSSGGYVSSNTSSSVALSSRTSGSWTISAGPARRVVVGLPVQFEATTGSVSNSDRYRWSFGDGASVRGRVAEHIYYSPGVYQVVLSGKSGERQAVARTTVEVLPADITLSIADTIMGPAVRIANNLDREINIGRMILQIEGNNFALPNDLIIDAGDTITLSPKDYPVSRGGELKMMTGEGLVLYHSENEARRLAGEIDRLKRELDEMERGRGLVYSPAVSAFAETAGPPETAPTSDTPDPDQIILNPQRSWWQKLLGW